MNQLDDGSNLSIKNPLQCGYTTRGVAVNTVHHEDKIIISNIWGKCKGVGEDG